MSIDFIPEDYTPGPRCLEGRVILVTGAASETGAAAAFAAAAHGAHCILVDRKQRELAPLYDRIMAGGFSEPLIVEFDPRGGDENACADLHRQLASEYPALHGLAHCALWGAPLAPIANASFDQWPRALEQQLVRPMQMTRALLPLLQRADAPCIVFTSMSCGRTARPYWGMVGAAFAALEQAAGALALEQQGQMRVNTLDPGRTRTALRKKFYPAEDPRELPAADAPAVTNAYLYLLSPGSDAGSGRRYQAT